MHAFNHRLRLGLAGALTASLLLLGAAVAGGAPGAAALTNCSVSSYSLDSEEVAFLSLINGYRAQNGLAALTVSSNLTRAAAWMAVDMGAKNYFSHTDSFGRGPSSRVQDCGFPGGAGENIAAGTAWDTAQEAFVAWKNSPGHNANMLNGNYKQIGIARAYTSTSTYKWYWVTDFSLISDGTNMVGGSSPSPTATPSSTATPPATATPAPTSTPAPSPTATSTPSSGVKAVITSPVNGSTFGSSTVTFSWTRPSGSREFRFDLGTTPGGKDLYSRSMSTYYTRLTLRGLPTDGRTLYVRMWTRSSAGWSYNDYVYKAAP